MLFPFSFILFQAFALYFSNAGYQEHSHIIMDLPGYPLVFELDSGESITIKRKFQGNEIERNIRLVSFSHFYEPNYWFPDSTEQRHIERAEVKVEVDGKPVMLMLRPYEMPMVVEGLRLFVESTQLWASEAGGIIQIPDVKKDVRFSLVAAGESWGPESLVFPINEYRWRSAVYGNTWSSLVPYNKLYYHRGEDFGAIPDRNEVIAPFDGIIKATAYPDGDGQSNSIIIENNSGISARLAHMNTESFVPGLEAGSRIKAGTVLAKTGETWSGRKSQHNDPHLHFELNFRDTKLATYPYLMEAYGRKYPDPVLAVAGGYRFTIPGEKVTLDASRSLPGRNKAISHYLWILSDGRTVRSEKAEMTYSKPGLYSEELQVITTDGDMDRDFVQVRVFNPQQARNISYGWAYYYPQRNLKVNTPILFWNRIVGNIHPVTINYGDGSEEFIQEETTHRYKNPGNYQVTLSTLGPGEQPVELNMEVKIQP